MIAAFLITLREVIEASLIVATILGILTKLNQKKGIRTVWLATGTAALVSVLLLGMGSLFGVTVQKIYSGSVEEFIEGILMILSAIFITWAVFFLHKYFARYKTHLLGKIRQTMESQEQKGLFWLAFTAVFREGFEIVLFLSTIFFSSHPQTIFAGFSGGFFTGLLISFGLFAATLRLPVIMAFRVTSALLILFAGGLFARGIHEFAEVGILPTFANVTRTMDVIQLTAYVMYVGCMTWWVFLRREKHEVHAVAE